jgi:hypothetical protein
MWRGDRSWTRSGHPAQQSVSNHSSHSAYKKAGFRDDTGGGESSFDLTGIDPTSAIVESGTVIDVSATVESTGDAEGTQMVTPELGGVSFERELTLASGDS